MSKREIVRSALEFRKPDYTPWQFDFTWGAHYKLLEHCGAEAIEDLKDGHIMSVSGVSDGHTDLGNGLFRDAFGVVWNRSCHEGMGVVEGCLLPEPNLRNLKLPDPHQARIPERMAQALQGNPDYFRVFAGGGDFFTRAWSLRGMENLLMDFVENPQFVRDLFRALADYYIALVRQGVQYDIDAVYFADDWGQQRGLIMGPKIWREFILPELRRVFREVRQAGKFVMLHSCGDVAELFDDLVEAGLNCFNPFQPEVMDTDALLRQYHGRLAFYGGLSTQQLLPYGSVDDVRRQTRHLLELGAAGGYIFAPAHTVMADVPVENMLAFIDECRQQVAFPRKR